RRRVGSGSRHVRCRQRDLQCRRSQSRNRSAPRALPRHGMTTRQQWMLVASIVSVIALGLVAATRLMRDELFPITIGSTAPNFRAKVLGANRYKSLEDYKGKVVLLN